MEDLFARARKRDADAFSEIVHLLLPDLYRTGRAILRNDEDVADAVQDAILAAWEKVDSLREPRYGKTWFIRILIRCSIALQTKKEVLTESGELPDQGITDGRLLDAEWRETMEQLDEKYRIILVLYYLDNLSTVEISRVMDMPEATVRTRLARGREKLAMQLRER